MGQMIKALSQSEKVLSTFSPKSTLLLQRKCACGGSSGIDGLCAECRDRRLTSHGSAFSSVSSPLQNMPGSLEQAPSSNSSVSMQPAPGHDLCQVRIPMPEGMQTKLAVNEPGDQYEREADIVSEQVMRMVAPASSLAPSAADDNELEDGSLMRKERSFALQETTNIPPAVNGVLSSDGGQALDGSTRSFMEPRFGHDFSQVHIHTDSRAAGSAHMVNALAYTVGRDIVFGMGQYAPETNAGRRLLAHELTHVLQTESKMRPFLTHHPRADKHLSSQESYARYSQPLTVSQAPLAIRREAVRGKGGEVTAVKFTIGVEVTQEFVDKAKILAKDGKVSDRELGELSSHTKNKDTVDDNERMFMAALLDAKNVKALLTLQKGASITFSSKSIQDHIGDVIDPGRKSQVPKYSQPVQQIKSDAGSFSAQAAKLLAFIQSHSISPNEVLQAMHAAASDNNATDKVMAGTVFAIAAEAKSSLAKEIVSGNVKVDGLSRQAFVKAHPPGSPDLDAKVVRAFFQWEPVGGLKGNTVYISTDFDIDDLKDRSFVIHELTHRLQSVEGTEQKPVVRQVLAAEVAAFISQAQYVLEQIASQPTDQAKLSIATQFASKVGRELFVALAIAVHQNFARYESPLRLIYAHMPGHPISIDMIKKVLANKAGAEKGLENEIRKSYGQQATETITSRGRPPSESFIQTIVR